MVEIIDVENRLSVAEINYYMSLVDTRRDDSLVAYYEGKNPPIIKEGYNRDLARKDPNNVIPLPIARKTINDVVGYAYKSGNVTYKFDGDETSQELITTILDKNEEQIESNEIFTDACILGTGAEVMYFDGNDILFARVDPRQCYFRYSDDVKGDTLEFSMRFYKSSNVNKSGGVAITDKLEVYTSEYVHFYDKLEASSNYIYRDSEMHIFGKVPLYPYAINRDKMGIYEASVSIIDKLDGLGSESIANSIDQFNDTILMLSKTVTEEDAFKIKELKLIDGLGDKTQGNFAEFLQRNLDIAGTLESTKLFERWYYEYTGVPNLDNDKFSDKSGLAMLFALIPFENLISAVEGYFNRGLKYRIMLIQNGLKVLFDGYRDIDVEVDWKRNLPQDIKNIILIMKDLKEVDIVSN